MSGQKKKIKDPHDGAFDYFFREKETALSFLEEYLPMKIKRKLDFNSLKISKDTFVDKEMARYFSDVLYEIKLNDKPAFLYLLFEHKSWEDWFICLQLLKYMVKIWENYLKQEKNKKYLPVIIPLVIYHGERKWKIDKNFISLFADPEDLEEYIPDFSFNLYDISHMPDEELKGTVLLKIILIAFKYIFSPNLRYKLGDIFKLFLELHDKRKGIEYLEVLLRYLASSARDIKEEELLESVTQILEEGGDIMQTIAEKWIKKGKEQGMEKFVKSSLKEGLPIETIKRITGFPEEKINRMKEKMDLKREVRPS